MADTKRSYTGMMLVTAICIIASLFLLRAYVYAPQVAAKNSDAKAQDGDQNPAGDAPLRGDKPKEPGTDLLVAKSTSPATSIAFDPARAQPNLAPVGPDEAREPFNWEATGYERLSPLDDGVQFTEVGRDEYTAVFSNRGATLAIWRFVNEEGEVSYYRTPDSPMVRPGEEDLEEGAAPGLLLLGPPRTLSRTQLGNDKQLERPSIGQNPYPEKLQRGTEDYARAWSGFPDSEAATFGFRGIDSWRNAVAWELETRVEKKDHTRVVYKLPKDADGITVRKVFEVYDAFKVVCKITFTNGGEQDYKPSMNVYGPVGIRHDVKDHQYAGMISLYDDQRVVYDEYHERFQSFPSALEDYEEELADEDKSTNWFVLPVHRLHDVEDTANERLILNGLSDGYFIAAIGIDQWDAAGGIPGGEVVSLNRQPSEQTTAVTYNFPQATLPGSDSKLNGPNEATWRVVMYAGPRNRKLVDAAFLAGNAEGKAARDTQEAIEWKEVVPPGWPAVISSLIRGLLDWLNSSTGNVAISILLLTLIVRLALAVLSIRAQYSMQIHSHKMKKIKPKLDAVREKYKEKKDRESQMLQFQEIRAVMKTNSVGFLPLGGCLPIILQMPIFIALFNSLRTSFMLRHESFLWMNDLSRPDALLGSIEWSFPLLTSHGHLTLNLLPLIWGGLLIYQQLRQPKATDPQQANAQKMTRIIFFIFPLMWYAMPAGFMLYFVASSIYTQIESRLVKLYLIKKGIIDKDEAGTATAAMM